jgi:hypothetical protein
LFPDYLTCKIEPLKKLSAFDGNLHVVYGGGVTYEQHPGCRWQYIYNLCCRAEELGIYMHLYFTGQNDPRYQPYKGVAKCTEYVQFHAPLKHEDWLRELSKSELRSG